MDLEMLKIIGAILCFTGALYTSGALVQRLIERHLMDERDGR